MIYNSKTENTKFLLLPPTMKMRWYIDVKKNSEKKSEIRTCCLTAA